MWPSRKQDTVVVRKGVAIAAAIFLIAGISWFGIHRYRIARERLNGCEKRNAVFNRRVEDIKRDAEEQLKVGANKAEITRFFTAHGIPFEITSSEAVGTLYTTGGCAPLGCGTDRALIGVRVKIDALGTVMDKPVVVGMYVDCV